MKQLNALEAIADERQRQIEGEGWTPEHDDKYNNEELARAAACYAAGERLFSLRSYQKTEWRDRVWPWAAKWWKPGSDRRRRLVKAGALIVAEIERLDRAAPETDYSGIVVVDEADFTRDGIVKEGEG